MILQPLSIPADAARIISDDTVRRIRQLYNDGAEMHFIITYILDNDNVMLQKSIVEDIGLRRICRDVSEPNGSECLAPGMYGILAEQYRYHKFTDEVKTSLIEYLKSYPLSSIKEIMDELGIPEWRVRKIIDELHSQGMVEREMQKVTNRSGGRPKELWYLNIPVPNR